MKIEFFVLSNGHQNCLDKSLSSIYIDVLLTDGHDTDTVKFGKVKVQNNVGLKCFIKQC